MGAVLRARDVALDRNVAIKVVATEDGPSPEITLRFQREARALATLRHPNVVPVYALKRTAEFDYFVMELVDGPHLGKLLRRQIRKTGGPFPPEEALALLEPIASALDYAHAQGLVHRDVKPQNIIIGPDKRPVLVDFGVARLDRERVRLTRSGAIVGTPSYMAPEQAMGTEVTPATDIYALGIVLYELLTGRTPFEASTALAVLCRVQSEDLPVLKLRARDQLVRRLDVVLRQATAKDPTERFSSARELILAAQEACSAPADRGLAVAMTADLSVPVIDPVPEPAPDQPVDPSRAPTAVLATLAAPQAGAPPAPPPPVALAGRAPESPRSPVVWILGALVLIAALLTLWGVYFLATGPPELLQPAAGVAGAGSPRGEARQPARPEPPLDAGGPPRPARRDQADLGTAPTNRVRRQPKPPRRGITL